MKCPYQTTITHIPERCDGYYIHNAKDVVKFNDCVKNECPFYDAADGCLRANKEIEKIRDKEALR